MQWDNDIATLALSDEEKDGLQAYRNYSASFTSARQKQFSDGVDYLQLDLTSLREVMSLITTEDIRLVPVIACAFADEDLKEMYKTFLPKDGPSGKSRLHDRFSPIGDLFTRIHFAYAFDMIHSDILKSLDRLREHRNKVSHAWNPSEFADFFETPLPYMDEIEAAVIHRRRRYGDDAELSAEASLRVRTIWLLARLFYETRYYPLAKMAELRPFDALYGHHHHEPLLFLVLTCARHSGTSAISLHRRSPSWPVTPHPTEYRIEYRNVPSQRSYTHVVSSEDRQRETAR